MRSEIPSWVLNRQSHAHVARAIDVDSQGGSQDGSQGGDASGREGAAAAATNGGSSTTRPRLSPTVCVMALGSCEPGSEACSWLGLGLGLGSQ